MKTFEFLGFLGYIGPLPSAFIIIVWQNVQVATNKQAYMIGTCQF
jgi:hypothetical protein